MNTRGNKARRDKSSILADTKNLLAVMLPAIQSLPKIERIEGAPREMKQAAVNIIRCFQIARECPEVRQEKIREMIGEFGVLISCFDVCITQGLFTDKQKLAIATYLEKIEEGIVKWRNASRGHSKSQERAEISGPSFGPQEPFGSTNGIKGAPAIIL